MVAIVTYEVEPASLVRQWWTAKKGEQLLVDGTKLPLFAFSARTVGKYQRDGGHGVLVQVTYWHEESRPIARKSHAVSGG